MSHERSHWNAYHRRWAALDAPLRPNPEVVERITRLVGDSAHRVLLLGVTPELATAFENLLAIDRSGEMIESVWPGSAPTRTVRQSDWLALDTRIGSFSAIVGDGSCNVVGYPEEIGRLLEKVRDLLGTGGLFVCRVFARPNEVPPVSELVAQASRLAPHNFHAFKWKLAMRIAEDAGPSVPVVRILQDFERLFPDRDVLAERAGWPRTAIDTIDAYRDSPAVYCFPKRAEFVAQMPHGLEHEAFLPSGTYDLAEHCPIMVCRRR